MATDFASELKALLNKIDAPAGPEPLEELSQARQLISKLKDSPD